MKLPKYSLGAHVVGDVDLGENVSVWYNAVVRGDTSHVSIGKTLMFKIIVFFIVHLVYH